jgi:hypothetical protein
MRIFERRNMEGREDDDDGYFRRQVLVKKKLGSK